MFRSVRRASFGIALGIVVGWLAWSVVDEPIRQHPPDEVRAAAPLPDRVAVRWTPAARELLREPGRQAPQPGGHAVDGAYRLYGTVTPPPAEGSFIRILPRNLIEEQGVVAPIGPDGSFTAPLLERQHPGGQLAFARVENASDLLFAGMVPLLSGVLIELWPELRVQGRVSFRTDHGSSREAGVTEALNELRHGQLELFFEGAAAGRVARTMPRDDGSFEIVLRPPTDPIPISIVSRSRRVLLGRVVRSRAELRSRLDIELALTVVSIECRSSGGHPFDGPLEWSVGWRREPGEGPYFPIVPALLQADRASFIASAGEIAGIAAAPGHAPAPFRVAVENGTAPVLRLEMRPTEPIAAQVRLRDAAGRPTGGWAVVRIAGQPADAPGAVLASALADDTTGVVDLQLPSAQPVDVHCGLVGTPNVGVLTRGWDPRDALTVSLATPSRVEIVPRYLAGQPACDGREPQWVLVPAIGGEARSGVVAQSRVPVDLLPGRYLVIVGGGDAGFAGVVHCDVQPSDEPQTVEVPMLPATMARVRVDGGEGDGRVFVRIAGLDGSPLERLFSASTRDGGSVELPVPDFERPVIRYEQADGKAAEVVWDGVRDLVLQLD